MQLYADNCNTVHTGLKQHVLIVYIFRGGAFAVFFPMH